MIPDERRYSMKWFYQCIQSRYGFNPHHLRLADACEFFIGQGCKVGLGGHLMGQKVTDQVAEMRSLPAGIDQRSPARHPDWLGPDDLALKIQEVREATNWEIPIQLKLGAARVYDDVRMAVKCDPDSIYIDAMEGGTGAGPHVATEDTGVPGIAAIREARRAIDELGKKGEISLVYAGGIRNGGDVAKALALGADAIAIGHSMLMALNCNKHIAGVTDYPDRDRRRGRLLLSLPHRPLPGRRRDPGPGAAPAARSRQGGRARLQLPPHAHDGSPAAGARLRQDQHPFARARGSGGADHGSVRHVQGAARRHQLHGRHRRRTITILRQARTHMAGTSYKGSEIKSVDQFIKDKAGLSSSREKEIGQHIGYRYDVNLLPDYARLTPFLKGYMEFMGWDDLNWLEDVHMGYEEGEPAIFDRNVQWLGAHSRRM